MSEPPASRAEAESIDPLYFTPGEFFKGIRLAYNEIDFKMFREKLFPERHHTDEYVMKWYQLWGRSPFQLWCNLGSNKRKELEFIIYECARHEAQAEGAIA